MRGRVLFVAGLGVGYVLGARAGRGAYDALRSRFDATVHSPQVGHALDAAKHAAESAAPQLAGTVEGVAGAVAQAGSTPPAATVREDASSVVPSDADAVTATD